MKTNRTDPRPLIGVTPDFNGNRQEFGGKEPTHFVRNRYLNAVWEMGGIPFILPLTEKKSGARMVLDRIDGLLLTGSGPDLPPSLYQEKQKYRFPLVHPLRTWFEISLCRLALKEKKPILGICGGSQLFNVALKGSLIQDIPSEVDSPLFHRQKEKYEKTSHRVDITPGSLLHEIFKKKRIQVNSFHHQSVKTLGKGLKISAVSPDGVIEGIEYPDHPFALGVQWHPECLYQTDIYSRRLFQAFIRIARSKSPSL